MVSVGAPSFSKAKKAETKARSCHVHPFVCELKEKGSEKDRANNVVFSSQAMFLLFFFFFSSLL
jgi:hypothetical protein